MKKLAISFSGGGIKAVVNIGIMKLLQENKIPIYAVSGMSGGSLIASAIAAGVDINKIKELMAHAHLRQLFHLNEFKGFEIIDHNKFLNLIRSAIGDMNIEDCKNAKLLIYTTDINNRKAEIISSGNLATAIVASCAMPPMIAPYQREGKTLVDGGFTTYYGAGYLRNLGADAVIGIDPGAFQSVKFFFHPVLEFTDAVICLFKRVSELEKSIFPVDLELTEFNSDISPFELSLVHEDLIDIGYQSALKNLDKIKELVFS